MKKSLSKKAKKVIEKSLEEFRAMPPLTELTRIGARMMLQVALEEEITANLERDYYERSSSAKGRRNGSKPRTVKIGSGDIGIRMPQVRNAGGPFHSLILPPRVTQMDEIQEIISLNSDEIMAPPTLFKGLKKKYLSGIGKKDDRIFILLNIDYLLTSEEKIILKETEEILEENAETGTPPER